MFPWIKRVAICAMVAASLVQAAPRHSLADYPLESQLSKAHEVTYCSGVKYSQKCKTQRVLDGVCTEVTSDMDNLMRSFRQPPPGVTCVVYQDPGCENHPVQIASGGSPDLYDATFQVNGVTNFKCTAPGAAPKAVSVKTYSVPICVGSTCTPVKVLNQGCTEAPAGISTIAPPPGVECELYNYNLCQGVNQLLILVDNSPVPYAIAPQLTVLTFQCYYVGKWAYLNDS